MSMDTSHIRSLYVSPLPDPDEEPEPKKLYVSPLPEPEDEPEPDPEEVARLQRDKERAEHADLCRRNLEEARRFQDKMRAAMVADPAEDEGQD